MSISASAIEIIGLVAATLTTISFLPQAIHTIKTKDVSGISFTMYALFTLGVFMWLVYGLLIDSLPVILANVMTFILALTILVFKWRFDGK